MKKSYESPNITEVAVETSPLLEVSCYLIKDSEGNWINECGRHGGTFDGQTGTWTDGTSNYTGHCTKGHD